MFPDFKGFRVSNGQISDPHCTCSRCGLTFTKFLESNNLLPENQHGFRANHSTVTALTAMQSEWIRNTEEGLVTGILIWDLSAAYDTVDTDLLCEKLRIYGCDTKTCDWFKSFMSNRIQRVKIGDQLSSPITLESGLPQGGILSPIIFTVYGADLEQWLQFSKAFTYADDSQTDSKDKNYEEMMKKLSIDAGNVLDFMASNGLVANASKTVFMVLNTGSNNKEKNSIIVGECEVPQSSETKLLGMQVQDSMKWDKNTTEMVSALNSRLFQIRRIKNHIPKSQLRKVIHSLWFSKVRYGMSIWSSPRTEESETINSNMKKIQLAQNRLLRMLEGVRIKDRISISSMLEKHNFPSINQLSAEVKLTETWKAMNIEKYPTKMVPGKQIENNLTRALRPTSTRELKDNAKSRLGEQSFCINAGKIWNNAPSNIKEAKTLSLAKKLIKIYCKNLPI